MSSREARGRWAFEDFGAPRLEREIDRAIQVATDIELIEALQRIGAEVQQRARRRPAFFEAYGLISTLPKIEPTHGLFAGITTKVEGA